MCGEGEGGGDAVEVGFVEGTEGIGAGGVEDEAVGVVLYYLFYQPRLRSWEWR